MVWTLLRVTLAGSLGACAAPRQGTCICRIHDPRALALEMVLLSPSPGPLAMRALCAKEIEVRSIRLLCEK